MIRLQNICKHYELADGRFFALNNVNLNIEENEFVAIIGASGSGKSTLMNILGCIDEPSDGEYWLDNFLIKEKSDVQLAQIRNSRIGFVFQNFNLFPRLTVLDNVIRPLIYSGLERSKRKELANPILEKLGIGGKATQFPNMLSGGQRQRVAIARALVTQPSILLADEPTGNLDSKTTEEILRIFEQLHRDGQTIIMVTHEDNIAARCHRRIRMHDGQVAQDSMNAKYQ